MGRFYNYFSSALGTSVLILSVISLFTKAVLTPFFLFGVPLGCVAYAVNRLAAGGSIRIVSPIQVVERRVDEATS
ncbi:MAG: hypothetical protein JNL18_14200 [Planctomycetaceae bacterium]|nr:hypothetical protein [Planctomycetaceae bacterium]